MNLAAMSDDDLRALYAKQTSAPPVTEDLSSLSDEELMTMYSAQPGVSSFSGLSAAERGELASQRLGTEEPSALDVGINAVRGAAYAAGDIPAGIDQLASRYLPMPDSWEQASEARVAEYESAKKAALDAPGGTVGYVGGQIGTAFVPGTGPLKVAANAGKVTKVLAHAKPVAVGAGLTAVKPYETEGERFNEAGISTGLGAAFPAVTAGVRAIGGAIRPRVPTGKPRPSRGKKASC